MFVVVAESLVGECQLWANVTNETAVVRLDRIVSSIATTTTTTIIEIVVVVAVVVATNLPCYTTSSQLMTSRKQLAVELLLVYSWVYSSSRREVLFDRRLTSMELSVVVERTVIEVVPILAAHWLRLMKTLKYKKLINKLKLFKTFEHP